MKTPSRFLFKAITGGVKRRKIRKDVRIQPKQSTKAITNVVQSMKIKHVHSHRRGLMKIFDEIETRGLDVETLDMQIDKHALKKIETNKICIVEIWGNKLKAEFIYGHLQRFLSPVKGNPTLMN